MNKPKPDYEMVKDLEVEGINFSISNKKLINCKFTYCNILYSGGLLPLGSEYERRDDLTSIGANWGHHK